MTYRDAMQPPRVAYDINRLGARNAVVFHTLVATGFLVFGAIVWGLPDAIVGATDGTRFAVGAVTFSGAAFFGWIGFRFLDRLRSDAPLFVLDPKGIYDNGSAVYSGLGWIPWRDIEDVRVGRYHNLPCVEIVLADRDRLLANLPWIERIGRSERLAYPAVAFRVSRQQRSPERLVEEIRAYVRSLPSGGAWGASPT